MSVQKIIEAINSRKTWGYSCEECDGNVVFFLQFAMKREGSKFICYFFKIPVSEMDVVEDIHDYEKLSEFNSFDDALDFIRSNGGCFENFSAFKGLKPI